MLLSAGQPRQRINSGLSRKVSPSWPWHSSKMCASMGVLPCRRRRRPGRRRRRLVHPLRCAGCLEGDRPRGVRLSRGGLRGAVRAFPPHPDPGALYTAQREVCATRQSPPLGLLSSCPDGASRQLRGAWLPAAALWRFHYAQQRGTAGANAEICAQRTSAKPACRACNSCSDAVGYFIHGWATARSSLRLLMYVNLQSCVRVLDGLLWVSLGKMNRAA